MKAINKIRTKKLLPTLISYDITVRAMITIIDMMEKNIKDTDREEVDTVVNRRVTFISRHIESVTEEAMMGNMNKSDLYEAIISIDKMIKGLPAFMNKKEVI